MKKVIASRQQGIEFATSMVGHPAGDRLLAGQYSILEQHRTLVGPNGEALAPASATRKAVDTAYAEGFIAAFRTGTEF